MERPLSPPLRIQVISTDEIPPRTAQKRIAAFLDDFQARSTSTQEGNTAVTVQLQKLMDALKEDYQHVKKRKDKKMKV
jgi:restriction endonuclease S subunit